MKIDDDDDDDDDVWWNLFQTKLLSHFVKEGLPPSFLFRPVE